MTAVELVDELGGSAFKAGMQTALSFLEKTLMGLPGDYIRKDKLIEAIQDMRRFSSEWTPPPSEVNQ